MYRGVQITEENIDRFRHLIPELYAEDLLSGYLRGAAMIDTMHGSNAIMGVVLLRSWNGWMEICWIQMSEAYDTDDYGADLIWNVTEFIRGWENFRGIYAKIFPSETKQLSYFRMAGFKLQEDLENVMEFTMGDIEPGELLQQQDVFDKCRTLEEMSREQRMSLEKMLGEAADPLPIEFPIDYSAFDQNLSAVYEEKGEIKAVILLSTSEKWISVDFAYSTGYTAFVTLLSFIYQWAQMLVSADQRILVPILSWKSAKMVKKLAPKAERQRLWLATRDYEVKRENK